MTPFEMVAALLAVAAAFGYLNHRWLRLPTSIGLMSLALFVSAALLVLDRTGVISVSGAAARIVEGLHFSEALLNGLLGALLFAGALHIDLNDLHEEKLAVSVLALGGTVLSTFAVGLIAHYALGALGLDLPLGYGFLFGALISPTDPIAVLGILKRAKVPRSLEIQISGESLFNDGVGVVIFLTVLEVLSAGTEVTVGHVAVLFAREALGGAVFGLLIGYVAYWLIRSIDHYQTELLITLALVAGGYAVAQRLHLSAPIAAVVAGLFIGNHGRALGMSDVTREHLDKFWLLVDDVLNSLLFVVVGFELVLLKLTPLSILAGLLMIPVVLFSRLGSVATSVAALLPVLRFPRGAIWLHTWGGLRGGISVALALALPPSDHRDLILTMTYFVVVFSILGQGLTLGPLARRLTAGGHEVAS